jgi:hypothetical protein
MTSHRRIAWKISRRAGDVCPDLVRVARCPRRGVHGHRELVAYALDCSSCGAQPTRLSPLTVISSSSDRASAYRGTAIS